MLVSGDYDLSLSLRYEEPVKEAFKETILRQEYTFKKQVYELHRLYDTQKTMMKDLSWEDLSWKELDGVYFSREGRQANPVAFGNYIRPSYRPAEKRICTPRVFNWLQEQQGTFAGFQQRLSNPQICSTHYLDHIGGQNLNKRRGCCSTLENPTEKKHYYRSGLAHHSEEVNLSLSIGRNNLKTSARSKTFNHIIDLEESDETLLNTRIGGRTKTWIDVIDSEESDQKVSNAELKPQFPLRSAARASYSGYKRDYQSTLSFTNNTKDNWFDATPRNYFVQDGSKSCLEQNPFPEGVEQCAGSFLSEDISGKSKVIFPDERAFLDLNKSIFDDPFHSDNPSLACSSNRASSRESQGLAEPVGGTFSTASKWIEQNDTRPNDASAFVHRRILNSATGSSCSFKSTENVGVEQLSINLNQRLSNISGNPGSLIKNFEYEKADSTFEGLDRENQAPRTPEMKGKKSEQDALSSPEYKSQDSLKDIASDRSPSSCKSSCFEDISSGIETMRTGTQLGNSSSFDCNAFQNSETLQPNKPTRQEVVDSFSNSADQKGKAAEIDGLIIKGAVSLVCLALECSDSNAISMNKIEGESKEQPQCSSDTFEQMVLKQPESSIDDCCVTSNAFEVNDIERKNFGITLKRGRRMKDFQRDIMPSLATLSRHEISEDIKIMETALRSREYKKLRSKMTGGEKWFNPVRSRRSRLKYIGRKHYS